MTGKLKTDVAIIGTGGAGIAAAISAAEGGAKVVVFEKRRNFGGISVTGMGIFAVESRLQRLKNVPFTRDQVFKLFMDRTHWMADARLVRTYIDKTAGTIDWLEGMGIQFDLLDITTFPGCLNQTGHIVRAPQGGWHGGISAHMIKLMKERAEKLGVKFYFATPVKKIVKTGRRITGVVAADKSGHTIEVAAKAVVVAAGGYVHNKEMMAKFGGFELGHDFHIMHTIQLEGDGIQMAWAMGAVPDGMYPQLAGIGVAVRQLEHVEGTKRITFVGRPHPPINAASRQPYLWVNLIWLTHLSDKKTALASPLLIAKPSDTYRKTALRALRIWIPTRRKLATSMPISRVPLLKALIMPTLRTQLKHWLLKLRSTQ
jgi:succinate dehydrogenase/fumarate reductase flavoprotein subunit